MSIHTGGNMSCSDFGRVLVLNDPASRAICFQGRSNNEMMKKFIELKGPVPRKLLRKVGGV